MSNHAKWLGAALIFSLVACVGDAAVGESPAADSGSSEDTGTRSDTGSGDSGTETDDASDTGTDAGNDAVVATAPNVPTAVTATADVAKGARLTWTAPTSNGGSAITTYTITSSPATTPVTVPAAQTSAVINALTLATSYTFTVKATNAIGDSPSSAPSNAVVIVDGPTAPTGVGACPADQQISFSAPAVATAVSYKLYFGASTGVTKATGTAVPAAALPFVHTGRTNGTKLYYVMTAINASNVESADSAEVSATPGGAAHDLFVAHSFSGTKNVLEVFDCFSQIANNATPPTRKIQGANTLIAATNYNGVAIDSAKALLYFRNAASILVFDNATRTDGNIAPARQIIGAATTLTGGRGVALDATRDILYVVDGATSIKIWTSASTRTGNLAPTATVTSAALGSADALYIDTANDRLYVSNNSNVVVLNNASTLTGAVAAARTISLNGGTLLSFGVAVDVAKDLLYVASRDVSGAVHRIANASTANGAVTPAATVTTGGNVISVGVWNNTLFSDHDSATKIFTWAAADTVTGAAAPTKSVNYPTVTQGAGFDYAP